MTVDDVVVRTVGLLLVTGATAAVSWAVIPDAVWLGAALAGSALASIALVLVISLRRITNPVPIVGYAILQGLLLGVASRAFEQVYPGIVVQAVAGTFGVFLGMAALYRARVIRATPRLARLVIGTLLGIAVLSVVNLVSYLITGRPGLAVYSVSGRGRLAAVRLLGGGHHRRGVQLHPRLRSRRALGARRPSPSVRVASAFGLLTGLVFLYWQLLRLLSYLRR